MSDERDKPADPPPPPLPDPAPDPAPPPMAAAPPPQAPTAPPAAPAYAPAPAAKSPLPWIIGGLIALALAVVAILYFTGVIGGSRGNWLVGTWGPGCPGNRSEVVTFNADGSLTGPGGAGRWSLSGDNLSLTTPDGQNVVVRWERLGQDSARVSVPGTGATIVQNRCS